MPNPERSPRPVDYTTPLAAYDRAWRRFQAAPTAHHRSLLETGQELLIGELLKPGRFELGQTAATPGALRAMEAAGHIPPEFLLRHKHGDWGEVDEHDRRENEWALANGSRLLSAYATRR